MKRLFIIATIASALSANAQIGYQVSLLDNATGEPRADETVTVEIAITDSKGKTICSERKSATTNDFGVLSLTVGNSSTFTDADWSALPFFISATVDGTLIGRSQILSVPIAEYAKQTGILTKEILTGTWVHKDDETRISYTFNKLGTGNATTSYDHDVFIHTFSIKYEISGNTLSVIKTSGESYGVFNQVSFIYFPDTNHMISTTGHLFYKR